MYFHTNLHNARLSVLQTFSRIYKHFNEVGIVHSFHADKKLAGEKSFYMLL